MATSDPISEPQIDYIKGLLEKRDISGLSMEQQLFLSVEDNFKLMNKGQASACITALKACPLKPEPAPQLDLSTDEEYDEVPIELGEGSSVLDLEQGTGENSNPTNKVDYTKPPQVPQGYFFITDPTETDPEKVEKFFRVRHGRVGTTWEGYLFLDVQASDYFYPVKDVRRRYLILSEIAKDPVSAMNQYGLRLGRCGVCNRTLTDRHSILRGIGPICAERLGPSQEQESLLRQLGLIKD